MVDSNRMHGKVVLVTGATAGLGKVTARQLAELGATVILAGRSREKCESIVADIKKQGGSPHVDYLLADLSSMQQVRDLAAAFQQKHDRLDVLVNNAGGLFLTRRESVDGFEMTFALNHLSYFLLTHLLLDTLKASAPSRIVNVSSGAHYGGALDFDDLHYTKRRYHRFQAYSDSKLMNVLFTYELARRLEGSGVTANVLHPGLVATDFGLTNNRNPVTWLLRRLANLVSISEEEGAETQVYLASSPEVEGVSGKNFERRQEERSSKASYNESDQRRLWDISAEMVGMRQQMLR